jgi:hypothetical protein
MDDVQGWGSAMDAIAAALWVKRRRGWVWAGLSKALNRHEAYMGGNGPAQVRGSPGGGVIGIAIVNVGAVRVKGKVKGCHMAVRLVCDCAVVLD